MSVSLGASGAIFGLFAVSVLTRLSWDPRKLLEGAILGQFVVGQVLSEARAQAVGGLKVGGLAVSPQVVCPLLTPVCCCWRALSLLLLVAPQPRCPIDAAGSCIAALMRRMGVAEAAGCSCHGVDAANAPNHHDKHAC